MQKLLEWFLLPAMVFLNVFIILASYKKYLDLLSALVVLYGFVLIAILICFGIVIYEYIQRESDDEE